MMAKSSVFILVIAANASLSNATLNDCSPSSPTWGSCDTEEEEKTALLQTHVKKDAHTEVAKSNVMKDSEIAEKETRKLSELTAHVNKVHQRVLATKDMKQTDVHLRRKWDIQAADGMLKSLMLLKQVPEANMSQVTDMGTIVQDTLLPGLLEAHNFSQVQLDEAMRRLEDCNTALETGLAAQVTPLETLTGEAKFNHTTCREAQKLLKENMTTMCDLLSSFLTNSLFPTLGESPELPQARTDFHQYEILAPEFVLKDRACNESTIAWEEKVLVCDGMQAAYQSDFCEYRQALLGVASTYSTCYGDNKYEYETLFAQLQEQVLKWKAEYTSIKKIECYLKVWLADADVNTVNATTATWCEEHVPDTSVMDIIPLVLDVPDAHVVDTSVVEEYPGTEGFPSFAYSNLQGITYNHDIPSCISETPTTPPTPPPVPAQPSAISGEEPGYLEGLE
jgi:hypothetical protein